jgi:two-component system probable response regulator PhcQ
MKRLLIVDDEPRVLHALRRELLRHFPPHELAVEICDDPLRALKRLCEVHFHAVISDCRMPDMDGLALLAHARELQPRATRMMISAAADVDTVLAAVNRAEVFRFITKPWTEQELVADVRAALKHESCAEPASDELERRRLEALEPGITHVEWGPHGEVLMSGDPLKDPRTTRAS